MLKARSASRLYDRGMINKLKGKIHERLNEREMKGERRKERMRKKKERMSNIKERENEIMRFIRSVRMRK